MAVASQLALDELSNLLNLLNLLKSAQITRCSVRSSAPPASYALARLRSALRLLFSWVRGHRSPWLELTNTSERLVQSERILTFDDPLSGRR